MTSTLTRKAKGITFYSLLEKYDGDIKKARLSELERVRPNGLKALFEAWRVYDKFHPKNANTPAETEVSTTKPNLTS